MHAHICVPLHLMMASDDDSHSTPIHQAGDAAPAAAPFAAH